MWGVVDFNFNRVVVFCHVVCNVCLQMVVNPHMGKEKMDGIGSDSLHRSSSNSKSISLAGAQTGARLPENSNLVRILVKVL